MVWITFLKCNFASSKLITVNMSVRFLSRLEKTNAAGMYPITTIHISAAMANIFTRHRYVQCIFWHNNRKSKSVAGYLETYAYRWFDCVYVFERFGIKLCISLGVSNAYVLSR